MCNILELLHDYTVLLKDHLSIQECHFGVKRREDPSTIVTILDDVIDEYDGKISLREALNYSIAGAPITFDPSLAGGTISLSAPLHLNGVMIDGASLLIALARNFKEYLR